MRNRKPRRFNRHRSNGRGHHHRMDERNKVRLGSNSFSNGRPRNNFNTHQNAEKLAEKYNALAKEALSSGDRVLSENYFQHADHFMRITVEKNLVQNQNKLGIKEEIKTSNTNSTEKDINSQQQSIEEKKE